MRPKRPWRCCRGSREPARAAAARALKQNPADPLAALLDVLSTPGAVSTPGGPRFVAASLYPDLESDPLPAVLQAELASPVATGRMAVANLLLDQLSPQAALGWLANEAGLAGGPLIELTALRAEIAAGQLQAAGTRLVALERSAVAQDLAGPAVQSAVLAGRRNDRAAARAAMDRAVALAPDSPRIRMLAGDLHLALEEPARAIPEYRKALGGWPREPRLLNQLAYALALAGTQRDREEALAHAETALRQQPHYLLRAALLDTRADLLFRLGRTAQALSAYRELSTTVGGMTTPEQWHRLGDLARVAGDSALARKAYEEALDHGREYPGRAAAMQWVDALAASTGQK